MQKNRNVTIILIFLTIFMLLLSFASVPIYRIFCQKTGYGGTTRIALTNASRTEDRYIKIRFNADLSKGLNWKFIPLQNEMMVKVGETSLAFYRVNNFNSTPITSIAVYNVTPYKAAIYFNKIHCFCFEEQIMPNNQTIDMPVQFFIDPDIVKDCKCDDVKTITLSYTYFSAKDPNIPAILGLPNPTRHQMRKLNKNT